MMTLAFRSALLLITASFVPAAACAQAPVAQGEPNAPELTPSFSGQTRAAESLSDMSLEVESLVDGLEHPWGMDQLPDGSLLVTERPGRLRHVAPDGTLSKPIAGVPEVFARDQGGLLDVAVGPTFAEDRLIYLSYAKPLGDGLSATAVVRARLSEDHAALTDVEDIFVQEPPSPTPMHYGSRILFENDRQLFITTGEHSSEAERGKAQDLATSYGKVIRVRTDGSAPPDNPFVGDDGALPTIWSYGHRNIQGAAIHPETRLLWTIEHGPRGGDELNLTEAGKNYGWPVISYGINYNGSPVGQGITSAQDMEQPVYYWDPVIAPAGMTFYTGDLFADWRGDLLVSSLTPGGIVRLELGHDAEAGKTRVVGEERLLGDLGRVRDIAQAPDGALLVLTDAANGQLLRLTPDEVTN
jgi:glucose/arabinose dehydrogenase